MEKVGLVLNTEDKYANISVQRPSGCGDNCGSCSANCDSSKIVINLKNDIGAKKGDLVKIKSSSRKVYRYALVIYLIPLVMFIMGILIGVKKFASELSGFLLGVGFLIISLFIIKIIDNKLKGLTEEIITMVEIIS